MRADVKVAGPLASAHSTLTAAKQTFLSNDGVAFPGYMEKTFWPISDQLILGKTTASDFVGKMRQAQIDYWKLQS